MLIFHRCSCRYFIRGRLSDSISIDIDDGQLMTLIDNAFDYERQTEIFIQVQARDTLQTMNEATHSTITQVRIDIIDVNDEPPTLKMVREQQKDIFFVKHERNIFPATSNFDDSGKCKGAYIFSIYRSL